MARTRVTRMPEDVRAKIRATQILGRLQNFVLGVPEPSTGKPIAMSSSQVSAAIALLKKTLPDLQTVEFSGQVEHRQRVVSADPLSPDEWAERYNPPAPSSGRMN